MAIDPTSRGFGFAVLEGSQRLIDWGVKQTRERKQSRCLELIGELIACYRPDVLVTEDCAARGCRRCPRVRRLLEAIHKAVVTKRVSVCSVGWARVRQAVAGTVTKSEIAAAVAARFPELARHLPPARRPWTSEDERMAIFDAMALALAWQHFADKQKQNR